MADVGVLLVGRRAAALQVDGVRQRVVRVCREPISPLEEDIPALVKESGRALFDGADADRWVLLERGELAGRTPMLWASSQVATSDVTAVAEGWSRVVVVAWSDEDALIPILRALPEPAVRVVLAGRGPDAAARRNHTVVAALMRSGDIEAALHVNDVGGGLSLAVEAVLELPKHEEAPRKAVDLGTPLGLPPTWAVPKGPIHISRLVHTPLMGNPALPELVARVAILAALDRAVAGPPADVSGYDVVDLDAARARLPAEGSFEFYRGRVERCLMGVEFVGDEPLVEQITRVLQPLTTELREELAVADSIETHRIQQLRTFSAIGIGYTVDRLRGLLDDVTDGPPVWHTRDLSALFDGALEGSGELCWRVTFAGVSSQIVRRGSPGWSVARKLARERFSAFRSQFSTAVATGMTERTRAARDRGAPLPRHVVQGLYGRAVRVRDSIQQQLLALEGEVLAGCEAALATDWTLRWLADGPADLRRLLERFVSGAALGTEVDRAILVRLGARPLGMSSAADFEAFLGEIAAITPQLMAEVKALPTSFDLMDSLLGRIDPDLFREAVVARGHASLVLPRGVPTRLLSFFEASGLAVDIRETAAALLFWEPDAEISRSSAETGRAGTSEHHLADLALAPPEGDSAAGLAALAEAAALLVVGLVVGELTIRGEEGVSALRVSGPGVAPTLLPFGTVHHLASDGGGRSVLAARIGGRLDSLPRSRDSEEAFLKLVELAELGLSPYVLAQLGIDAPRFKHLRPAIQALLRRSARRACASMIDHLRAEEVAALAEAPTRHGIVDALQLPPLGAG